MAMAAAVAKRCMNPACGAPATGAGGDWRKGWPLRSGAFALLCDKCGYGLLLCFPTLEWGGCMNCPPPVSMLCDFVPPFFNFSSSPCKKVLMILS